MKSMKRSGEYVSNLSGDAAYKSFRPSPLPPEIEMDAEMIELLTSATKLLSVLDTMSTYIPNMNLFVSMYVRKEALLSSQIEGTQATLEDVLDPMVEKNANQNVADVINYIKATEYALERIKTLPLCSRLIKETHEVLLGGVRGEEKNPGQFRISQNWIGTQGSSLKNARYIPPNVEDMTEAISDLEKYINSDDTLDVLIQAALIHYQFETIHPFLDGNGRVGRLLITLFLMEKKALNSPSLYISYYLKKNRVEYYDRMSEVRNKDNYEQWIKFFLRAVAESSDEAVDTIKKLSELHNKNVELISDMGRASKNAHIIFDYIEKNPIIDIRKTAEDLGMSFNTVSGAVKRFEECGILKQTNNTARNRVFAYQKYLDILRKDTE
ncbi:MAG: Fic family protein [Oscillospiraceae bacterium]|nr:Fic family protein [Oscillospiraceae bacterium]